MFISKTRLEEIYTRLSELNRENKVLNQKISALNQANLQIINANPAFTRQCKHCDRCFTNEHAYTIHLEGHHA